MTSEGFKKWKKKNILYFEYNIFYFIIINAYFFFSNIRLNDISVYNLWWKPDILMARISGVYIKSTHAAIFSVYLLKDHYIEGFVATYILKSQTN